jgi:sensor histidine kinase YesM
MKHYFFHHAIFRLVAPAIYGLLLYLLILLINNNVAQIEDLFTTQELYVCVILTYLSFESIRLTIILCNKMLKGKSPGLLMPVQFTITIVVSVGIVLLSLIAYFHYFIGFSIGVTQLGIFGIIFTFTCLLYNVMYFSNYYLHQQNTLKLHGENQQRAVLEMEMAEYKNDINPDLLYESLENLIGLMYRDVEKAEDYIDCLGSAYRYVLTNRQNELVTIGSELAAARNILRLLNEQYGDRIVLNSTLQTGELEGMLIPGSLPVILESMIRNTIITRSEPFVIHCYLEEDYLTIESKLNDRLILHQVSEDAFGRLQRSYSIFTDRPMIKVKAYQQNYIKLPVIRITEAMGTIE